MSDKITYRKLPAYKYQLRHPYSVQTPIIPEAEAVVRRKISLDYSGRLFIRAGYSWDGPSGPSIDTAAFMRASLVHDALYQLMREGQLDAEKYREPADALLRAMCIEDGMSRVRAWYAYRAVRMFGRRSAVRNEAESRYFKAP